MAIYHSSTSSVAEWFLSLVQPYRSKSVASSGSHHSQCDSHIVSGTMKGATAVGLSLIVLKLVGQLLGGVGEMEDLGISTQVILSYMRQKMRRVIQAGGSNKKTIEIPAPPCIIDYHGSCTCESVIFKIRARRSLDVVHGSGKIPYPQTKVKASSFQLIQGSEYLRIYHAYSENESPPSTLAYSFCSECAVHIVNASDANSNEVSVNVDCLHEMKQLQAEETSRMLVEEEDDDEVASLAHPDVPFSATGIDRGSPVSAITQPLHPQSRQMSSISEEGDAWAMRDPVRPQSRYPPAVRVPFSKMTSQTSIEWPTESESTSVYSGSYALSTLDMGSMEGSIMDTFSEADTASRQEMLSSMRKYLRASKTSSSRSSKLQHHSYTPDDVPSDSPTLPTIPMKN
jgi:hypothetical protein